MTSFEARVADALPALALGVVRPAFRPIHRLVLRVQYSRAGTLECSIDDLELEFDVTRRPSANWFLPRYAGEQIHEPAVTDRLLAELEADSVVWDVGTHVGWFASVAAAAIGSAGAVHAFDLDDSALASGAANAALNAGSTPVTTVHVAVSDTTGDSVAYQPYLENAWTPFGGPDRAVNAVTENRNGTLGRAETLRLDDYLERAAPPDVVKIDVEGHELAALRGFRRLGEIQPTLILAIHPAQLGDQDADPADVYDLLGRYGYVDLETLAEDDGYGAEPVRTVVATQ